MLLILSSFASLILDISWSDLLGASVLLLVHLVSPPIIQPVWIGLAQLGPIAPIYTIFLKEQCSPSYFNP